VSTDECRLISRSWGHLLHPRDQPQEQRSGDVWMPGVRGCPRQGCWIADGRLQGRNHVGF